MFKLYENIKKYRKALGLTQTELAELVGYTDGSMITKIESGKVDISRSKVYEFAKVLQTTPVVLMGLDEEIEKENKRPRGVRIPVLGRVAAGIPVDAIEEIIDYEEISEEEARQGEYFGLQIKGDSMYPRILDGDVVIVRKQNYASNSDVVIVLVNGNEGTCKQFYKYDDHVELKPFNLMYKPLIFNKEEVIKLPVQIIGKVVELRGKF
jgi:repressor LexA|nr:MAG TPA: LexA repressor [Caudoviricetes sp.]